MTLQATDNPFVLEPDRSDPLVDENGVSSQRFFEWIQGISERVPLEGNGSPEGSLVANNGRLYIDKSGTQGTRIYIKTTDGGNTGWELA